MTGAHLHLLLNHFPITGGLIGLALLLYAWVKRDDAMFRFGLGLFVVIALLTVGTFLTGEPAEGVIRDSPGFSRKLAHAHEEAGEVALIVYGVLGVVCLYGLIRYARRPVARAFAGIVLLLTLGSVGTAAWVGLQGGKIKHDEVRSAADTASAAQPAHDAQED